MNRTGQKDMKPGNRQHRRGGITESEMTPGQRRKVAALRQRIAERSRNQLIKVSISGNNVEVTVNRPGSGQGDHLEIR